MEFIKGMTFAPFSKEGTFQKEETYESLKALKENLDADYIILVPNGLQETAQSENISYTTKANVGDEELRQMIAYAKSLGLRVALKPTVNCMNGTWRAHINFFDVDVHCEPKWSNWFTSYTEFQLHYAKIAQETGCYMFIAGCEMVMSERREGEWRKLIQDIKKVYHGLVSYNTDKYQEDHINWWDEVDVISSSGYYPIQDWEQELDRIEKVVHKFQKPFFFAEAGCMSTTGSAKVPNDWTIKGDVNLEEQAEWYEAMLKACDKRPWVLGYAFWSWSAIPYTRTEASKNRGYDVYLKPAQEVIGNFYKNKSLS